MKIVIIGSLPPPGTGTTLLLKILVDDLSRREDLRISTINTTGIRGSVLKGCWRLVVLFFRILRAARDADVVTAHTATSGLPVLGPVALLAAKIAGKPFLIRKFGGTDFLAYPFSRRLPARWAVANSDTYLAETKMLVKLAREAGIKNADWYANSRVMPPASENESVIIRKTCRRFVYLGRVCRAKGIGEIIRAGECLNGGIVVDIYGPLAPDIPASCFAGLQIVRYRGLVPPDRVASILAEYDALLLPSYHPGEGYPGIILEAYSVGLPVICTRWRALLEIVDRNSGILIEPRDAEDLLRAMRELIANGPLYRRLQKGVQIRRGEFATDIWTERFVQYCRDLLTPGNKREKA